MTDKAILATLDRIENDLAGDRSRIDNLQVALESMASELKILKERLPRTETKMEDAAVAAMQQVAQPVIDATQKLTDSIEKAHKTSLLSKLFPKKK